VAAALEAVHLQAAVEAVHLQAAVEAVHLQAAVEAVHLQAAVEAVHLQAEIRMHLHLHLLPLLEQEELVAAEERQGMLAAVVKLVVPV
jgi:hypothetical protein